MSAPGGGGAGQAGLAEEFRAMADAALERLQPWVDQLCQAHAAQPGDESRVVPAACAVCPVCAVIAALRGERSELGTRLAEHAVALLAALRTALNEGQPVGQRPASGPPEGPPADERRAQPIRVDRADAPPGPTGGGGSSGAC